MKYQIKLLAVVFFLGYTIFLWTQLVNQPSATITVNPPAKQNEVTQEDEKEKEPEPSVSVFRQENEIQLPLEEYLLGVVASEMPVSFELEALKAQAIAARTFVAARNYQVDDTTASQVYKSDEELKAQWGDNYPTYIEKIKQAVNETQGKILTYQGSPITAAFFSSSNGTTNNAQDYWLNEVEYLQAVDSHWDNEVKENQKELTFSLSDLASKLGLTSLSTFVITENYDNGYVKSVQADDQVFTGRKIREVLALPSSSFTITNNGNDITFTITGSGHGIGMSQYGANGMALEGFHYDEILNHYYQNVKIEDLVYN